LIAHPYVDKKMLSIEECVLICDGWWFLVWDRHLIKSNWLKS